jgi:prolyl-tRNA editing enzyme YbaK/EbsC (Cys-tRNA(Pro) deacylase)
MSLESAKKHLEKFHLSERVMEFEHASSATVALAAEAIGCEPARIAKTLAVQTNAGPFVVVVAGDAKLDNRKFKNTFRAKPRMLTAEETLEATGHPVGGVCPFGLSESIAVYLDESMKRFETVFPACGSANSAIELDLFALEEVSASKSWIDVCKGWEGQAE